MKIAVLSGKGGTGKTLLSVNLAAVSEKAIYIDCDVEEPNGHLFFKPKNIKIEKIYVGVPVVEYAICEGCRICVDFCRFNALAYIKDKLIVFNEVCHSCGGCILLCPHDALTERKRIIGEIETGMSDNVKVITGRLNIGEESGIQIIKKTLGYVKNKTDLIFIDCPPGSGCSVMESVKDADYCILVAEPTLFGTHNLNMVFDLVNLFDKPFGVVLNKCENGKNPAEEFCIDREIKILGKIPFDVELGTCNSNAMIAANVNEMHREMFISLLQTVIEEINSETITHT